MPLLECPDCGGKVSDQAPACPHCGCPMKERIVASPPKADREGDAKCPHCGKMVTPVVTSVGGGTCSVGRREKWTCPACKHTMHTAGCFVATATYGDEDAIEVRFFRVFRDRVLARHPWGRLFIHAYYRVSPYLAWLVERFPVLKLPARWLLNRMVLRAEKLGPVSRADIRRMLSHHASRHKGPL